MISRITQPEYIMITNQIGSPSVHQPSRLAVSSSLLNILLFCRLYM